MILVAGSANLDFVVRSSHIPAPGETVLGSEFKTYPGGKGANQALACARAGGAVTHMLLALGDDAYALPLEQSLKSAGVELHIVRVKDQATGTAFICVAEDGQNAITVAPGANFSLTPADLPALTGFSHLLMQLEIPLPSVLAYARAASSQGVKVVLNAAPAQPLPAELLQLIDVLVVNQGELEVLAGGAGSMEQCLSRIDVRCIVVTLGEQGSCARVGNKMLSQAAFKVNCIDSTGAGDTFCGALVAALSRGDELTEALRQASAAGALACTQPGAQSSIPTQAEVNRLLA
jgi:ribokinase